MIDGTKPRVWWLFVLASALAACSASGGTSSATSVAGTTTTAPSASTVPATPRGTTTAVPVTTPTTTTTLPPPVIYRRSTRAPMAVDLQFSGAAPPSLIVASDGGRAVEVRMVGIPAGFGGTGLSWDDAARSARTVAPLEIDGTPFVIESLHSGFMATVAVTTEGRLAAIGTYGPTISAIPHPGRVTDVAMMLGPGSGSIAPSGGQRLVLGLWAAGFDQVDGREVAVVWETSGLEALDGEITGIPSTAVVVTGSAGAKGPVLVGVADANQGPGSAPARVFALLPEADGSSRLWVVQDAGLVGPTQLRFRDPTALEVTGDAVWIGDSDGLHRVGLAEPKDSTTTLWPVPVRVIRREASGSDRSPFEVIALDEDGHVIRTAGETPEVVWEDRAATDLTVVFGQLVILHGAENEVMVLDPNVLS